MNSKQRRKERRLYRYEVPVPLTVDPDEYYTLLCWCRNCISGEVKGGYFSPFRFTNEKDAVLFRLKVTYEK